MDPARRAALLALVLVLLAAPALAGAATTIRVGTYPNAPLILDPDPSRSPVR